MTEDAAQVSPESSESSPEFIQQDVTTPSSSVETPSKDGNGEAYSREELMEVVRKAVGDVPAEDPPESGEKAAESPPAEASTETADEAAKGEAQKDVSSEAPAEGEDYSDVPFNKHPRFQQLISEKNGLKAEVDQLSSQIETLTPGAEEWGKVSSYMAENGIAAEAMAELFEYAALVTTGKVDKALEMARKQVSELEALAGHQLSPDLQRRVDDGLTDEDTALQLSKAQSRLELERRMHQRELEMDRVRTQTENTQAVMDAVRQWENNIRGADPDYGLKHEAVQDRLKVELSKPNGMPSSAKAGVELVQRVYDEINAWPIFQNGNRATPKKAVTGGDSPRAPARQPGSMLEAVQMALDQ